MKRGFFFKKFIMILLCVSAAILVFGFVVMSLWNGILPSVLHVGTITFGQAIGLLVLCKILFGGFHGGPGRWGGRERWKNNMRDKWENMTPDEREKFKEKMKARCGGWGRDFRNTDATTSGRAPFGEAGTE